MKGLLLVHYYYARKRKLLLLLLLVSNIIFATAPHRTVTFYSQFPIFSLGAIPTYDSSWERQRLALPYSRKQVVSAHYLFHSVMGAVWILSFFFPHSITRMIRGTFVFRGEISFLFMYTGFACVAISTFSVLLFRPSMHTIWALLLFIGGILGIPVLSECISRNLNPSAMTAYVLLPLLCIASFAITLLSWRFSVRSYEQKDL